MRLLSAVLLLAALPVLDAPSRASPRVPVQLSALLLGDSAKVYARWGRSIDAAGPASNYRTHWSNSKSTAGFPVNHTAVADTIDSVMVPIPAAPDSIRVGVDVYASRTGLENPQPSSAVSPYLHHGVTMPPPPGPVKVDTIPVAPADATGSAITALLLFPVNGTLAIGDSTVFCTAYATPNGLHGLLFPTPQSSGPIDTSRIPSFASCHAAAATALGPLTGADFFTYSTDPAIGLSFPNHAYPPGGTPFPGDRAQSVPPPAFLRTHHAT